MPQLFIKEGEKRKYLHDIDFCKQDTLAGVRTDTHTLIFGVLSLSEMMK